MSGSVYWLIQTIVQQSLRQVVTCHGLPMALSREPNYATANLGPQNVLSSVLKEGVA